MNGLISFMRLSGNVSPSVSSVAGSPSPSCHRGSKAWNTIRSETMKPRTGSAGYVPSHPTKPEESPYRVAMFQSAGTRLMVLVMGTFSPVAASSIRKSMIPCTWGSTPVAMVVQIIGDTNGSIETRSPVAPSSMSLARLGNGTSFATSL